MEDPNLHKYEILQHLALAGARGDELQPAVQNALEQAAALVGLKAAAAYLWDADFTIKLAVYHAEQESNRERLISLEESMFANLRREKQLLSAYLSFAGEPPVHAFTLPLSHGAKVFGAIIGLQEGTRTVVAEDLFLEALSAALSLNMIAGGLSGDDKTGRDRIESERMGASVETAVTVNHEINNPLTAILGNVQLLLLREENLDPRVAEKLRIVEMSAMKIRDVTQKLLRITNSKSVEYVGGTSMLKLPDDDEPPDSSSDSD
jgi:K+-sensing histidine kinase KdpD